MNEFVCRCSFCGTPVEECGAVIASAVSGAVSVYICDACVEGCLEILTCPERTAAEVYH